MKGELSAVSKVSVEEVEKIDSTSKVISRSENVKNVAMFSDRVECVTKYLKKIGLPSEVRREIIESFDISTMSLETIGENAFGIRFYGGGAKACGPYLFETFTSEVNRANLALPPEWNSMSNFKQWKIKPGITVIKGRAAPQMEFGSQYIGGARQIWVPNPSENLIE